MNFVLEFLWVLLSLCYYILEALVLFFIPASYRKKDVEGQIVLITGAGTYRDDLNLNVKPFWSFTTISKVEKRLQQLVPL